MQVRLAALAAASLIAAAACGPSNKGTGPNGPNNVQKACAPGDAADCQAQCTAKVGSACTELGTMYLKGQGGLPLDGGKAANSFDQGCTLGDGNGCLQAGYLFT